MNQVMQAPGPRHGGRRLAVQRGLALVAVLFGIATLVAGGRVLFGADPGYEVWRPLLAFNTAMGVVYIAAGLVGAFDARRGMTWAAAIFVLNAVVLAVVGVLYAQGDGVAVESLRAMALRTVVWLMLCAGFVWLGRGGARTASPAVR